MNERDDWLVHDLACLHPIAPSPARAERVRSRCHAKIARHASKAAPSGSRLPRRSRLIDAVAAIALCIYLTAVLQASARLAGLL